MPCLHGWLPNLGSQPRHLPLTTNLGHLIDISDLTCPELISRSSSLKPLLLQLFPCQLKATHPLFAQDETMVSSLISFLLSELIHQNFFFFFNFYQITEKVTISHQLHCSHLGPSHHHFSPSKWPLAFCPCPLKPTWQSKWFFSNTWIRSCHSSAQNFLIASNLA